METQKLSVITQKATLFLAAKVFSPYGDFVTIFWAIYLSLYTWVYAKEEWPDLPDVTVRPLSFSPHKRRSIPSCWHQTFQRRQQKLQSCKFLERSGQTPCHKPGFRNAESLCTTLTWRQACWGDCVHCRWSKTGRCPPVGGVCHRKTRVVSMLSFLLNPAGMAANHTNLVYKGCCQE